jgi:chitinase
MKKLVRSLAVVCLMVGVRAEAAPPKQKIVVGYISGGRPLDAKSIAAGKMTRINYAFFRLKGNAIADASTRDADNLAVLTGLRKDHPGLAVLVSVGGGSGSGGFSDMALTKEGRTVFVESAVALVKKFNLDGIDVDWEYPGYTHHNDRVRPVEDKLTYTLLLKELRLRFNKEQRKLGRHLYTSSATGWSREWLDHTEMREASKWLDTVNLMCYDYYRVDDHNTGHDAPLYTNPADPKAFSTDRSVRDNLAAGVPKSKLVVGVPFYGKTWNDVPSTNNGLWQPIPAPVSGTPGYGQIAATMLGKPGWVRYWDPVAQAPYLYNAETRVFLTYDDVQSEQIKTKYVKDNGLAGVMFWQYTQDPENVLLDAVDAGLGIHP